MSLDIEDLKRDMTRARGQLYSSNLELLVDMMAELWEEDDIKLLKQAALCFYAQYLEAEQNYDNAVRENDKWK